MAVFRSRTRKFLAIQLISTTDRPLGLNIIYYNMTLRLHGLASSSDCLFTPRCIAKDKRLLSVPSVRPSVSLTVCPLPSCLPACWPVVHCRWIFRCVYIRVHGCCIGACHQDLLFVCQTAALMNRLHTAHKDRVTKRRAMMKKRVEDHKKGQAMLEKKKAAHTRDIRKRYYQMLGKAEKRKQQQRTRKEKQDWEIAKTEWSLSLVSFLISWSRDQHVISTVDKLAWMNN